jgi:hypothetical protein
MPPAGFEPSIPSSKRPQTHASDRAATGIGLIKNYDHVTVSRVMLFSTVVKICGTIIS